MKIIIPNTPVQVLHDIAQTTETIKDRANLEIIIWDVQHKPIIDMFDELKPDIVMIHESQLDHAFAIVCQEFEFKYVVVAANPLPEWPKAPSAIITEPSLVKNFPRLPVMQAVHLARLAQIQGGSYNPNMKSEVLVDTTSVEMNPNLYDLLRFLTSNYKTKIVGGTPVKSHHYLGAVNMFERADFIKSAQMVVDINSYTFWDASYLKVPSTTVAPNAPSHVLQFQNLDILKHNIESILSNPLIRAKYTGMCYKETLKENTFHHFAAKLFQTIKEPSVAMHLTDYITELTS